MQEQKLTGNAGREVPVLCQSCDDKIPMKRLRAVPDTKYCTACLERLGDVPVYRRYDEGSPKGELIEGEPFTNDQYKSDALERFNRVVVPESAYAAVLGDDLVDRRPPDATEPGYALSTEVFQVEDPEETTGDSHA